MRLIRGLPQLIIIVVLLLSAPQVLAEQAALLATPPLGERWFSITMGDERTGFAHNSIRKVPDGYEVTSDSSTRMVVLGFSREASFRETYLVNRDLSLKSFVVEQTVGGKPMRLHGEATAKGVKVTVESAGRKREETLKARGKVYPSPLLNLYPLMQGVAAGKKHRLQMFDPEEVKLREVTITVVGRETLAGGVAVMHLRNDLYPVVDNDIWVDLAGNTLRESVRDGLIVTSEEDAAAARKFVIDAAVARKELILDFSTVRVDRPIARPAALKRLVVELSGIPADLTLPSGAGQKVSKLDNGTVRFILESPAGSPKGEGSPLEPAAEAAPDNGELVAKKNEIVGDEKDPLRVAEKLASWVAANVAESPADSRSPLETLRTKKGDSRSRTLLYVSLARAAGIPARIVTGLVYVAGKGFLYHCWAESRLQGEWLAIDPSHGQVPADATHLKLADGDAPAELARLVGRVKAMVVEEAY